MKNLASKLVGNILLAVYSENAPTAAEHEETIAIFSKVDPAKVRVLTYTRGGAPTSAQRKDINNVLNGRELTSAIVTDSTVVRGVVTAFSWFNQKVKSFPTRSLDDAFRYLEVPQSDWERLRTCIAELDRELTIPTKKLA